MRFYTSCVLLSPFLLLQGLAQGTQVLNEETDAFINQILEDWNSPGGAAVAVVRRDTQGAWNVETKGYGIATVNGSRVTDLTRFAIGSNSKLFNIFATGLLINNETLSPRLSWASKIASVVPIWGLMDPIASKQASIIDVMSHRTGLPRHDLSYKWSDDVPAVIKSLKFLRPSAEFRDVWQYCNSMYTLLSYLPPLLLSSKTPFTRYVKQNILDPLGMTATTYSFDIANASGQLADGLMRQGVDIVENPFGNGTPRALPYWSTLGGEDGNVLSGAGGIISNAIDMATWLQTLLLEGVKPDTNTSVIPSSVIQKVATGVTIVEGVAQFPELSPIVYGGGQTRGTYRGHELIEHGGDVPGFHSQISRYPFDNLGVAVLTNDNLYGVYITQVIKMYLADVALGLEKIDWNSRIKALATLPLPPATPRPNNASLPAVNFTSLAGKYHNGGYGEFELCLVSPQDPAASPSCKALASNASTILPGVIPTNIPTFLAEWNNPFASYVIITHFNGNMFNASALSSYPTGDPSEPFWTPGINLKIDSGARGTFEIDGGNIGIGFTGIWGAGVGVPSPQGATVHERAEVWFDKT